MDADLTPGFYNLMCSTWEPKQENFYRLIIRGNIEILQFSDWNVTKVTGQWRNSTAASDGLKGTRDSRFVLVVDVPDTLVNICLSCISEEYCEAFGIGFTIWSFDTLEEPFGRSPYTKRASTVFSSHFKVGRYLIKPSTVKPGLTVSYQLMFYSDKPCKVKNLDF